MSENTTPEMSENFEVTASQQDRDGVKHTHHENGQIASITVRTGDGKQQMATYNKDGKSTGFGIV